MNRHGDGAEQHGWAPELSRPPGSGPTVKLQGGYPLPQPERGGGAPTPLHPVLRAAFT